jgi:hypothetical protein
MSLLVTSHAKHNLLFFSFCVLCTSFCLTPPPLSPKRVSLLVSSIPSSFILL